MTAGTLLLAQPRHALSRTFCSIYNVPFPEAIGRTEKV